MPSKAQAAGRGRAEYLLGLFKPALARGELEETMRAALDKHKRNIREMRLSRLRPVKSASPAPPKPPSISAKNDASACMSDINIIIDHDGARGHAAALSERASHPSRRAVRFAASPSCCSRAGFIGASATLKPPARRSRRPSAISSASSPTPRVAEVAAVACVKAWRA